jgi:hypothetical protein
MQLIKQPAHHTNKLQSYYAVVPKDVLDSENTVIDELIGFAFDMLGAWRLDVRVYDETAGKAAAESEREGERSRQIPFSAPCVAGELMLYC